MNTKNDNILEKGYWEEPNPPAWKPAQARATQWCVDVVRPSFWSKAEGKSKAIRRTAYLDGVRGFAAFLVYCAHHQLWAHELESTSGIYEDTFGYSQRYYFVSLPGIRTFFSGGHYAVTVFFVLSGYVLSAKPMLLIQAGEYTKLGDNLASSLFRRWLRLYLPVIATTFIYVVSWHLFGITGVPDPQPSFREEIWNYYVELKNFSFVFRTGGEPWFIYNFHAWSIPVEFKGSIVIYTTLAALSRSTRNARLWCEVGLIVYFLYIVDGWYCSLFVAGMLLCDLDLLAQSDNLPKFFSKLQRFKTIIFSSMFVVSIYLGGVPSHTFDLQVLRDSAGWHYLSFLKPQAVFDYKWFYLFWASTFIVASISRLPWLKTFFETRFCQYLGRVSFALYLVHGPVLWTLGDRLYAAVGFIRESHATKIPKWINLFPIPRVGPLGLEPSFFACQLILLPVTFWLAEIVTKVIDEPSVRFAQWAYNKTLAPSPKL